MLSERGYMLQLMHKKQLPAAIVQLLGRLQEKCLATEKELNAMPAAPKAAKDFFQLCRCFERAFSTTIDVSIWPTYYRPRQAPFLTLEAKLALTGCTYLL